jgi:methylenetetrahydrofolate reductase (NADPH)
VKTFRQALQGDAFTITAELALQRHTTVEEALSQARTLADFVDGIQIAESPNAWARVSPVALAGLLIRSGIDAIPRLTCRDRNRIALQSDLLGLRATGVTSVMLTSGEDFPAGHELKAKPVFDLNCHELIAMAQAMNEEGSASVQDELLIGTDTTIISPFPDQYSRELLTRASAGARFLQTQPCLDIDVLRRYMEGMVEAKITWNYSVIVSLAPLPSAELMREIASIPGISGINLLCAGNPEALIAAIKSAGL